MAVGKKKQIRSVCASSTDWAHTRIRIRPGPERKRDRWSEQRVGLRERQRACVIIWPFSFLFHGNASDNWIEIGSQSLTHGIRLNLPVAFSLFQSHRRRWCRRDQIILCAPERSVMPLLISHSFNGTQRKTRVAKSQVPPVRAGCGFWRERPSERVCVCVRVPPTPTNDPIRAEIYGQN